MTSPLVQKLWSPFVGLLLLSGLVAGCASDQPLPPPEAETRGNYVPLTKPFIAVGDTQEHESTGIPLHDNDSAIDSFIEVAQRPPQQTLFGRRLIEWVLTTNPGVPFVHLGDVMDLSCRNEGERIGRILASAKAPGVVLPGNHDGLMFGIYAYNLYDINEKLYTKKWNEACRGKGYIQNGGEDEALSKSGFIAAYLGYYADALYPEPGPAVVPAGRRHTMSWRSPDDHAFLSAVEGEIYEGKVYADSFLAQLIKLRKAPGATRNTFIIGLDTNQAGPLVDAWDTLMGRSPGDEGHVHSDQLDVVEKWVDQAKRQGDIVIFAGHHNWQSLSIATRLSLRLQMRKLDQPLVYLSAHTHTGFWTTHRLPGGRPILELNVSSLSDWPLAYRRISFAYDEAAKRILVRGELQPAGDTPVTTDTELLEAWSAETCAKTGHSLEKMRQEDMTLVRQQRDSRGTVLEWLEAGLGPICATCEEPLYDHALLYQDQLLNMLLEVNEDLGLVVHNLHFAELPAWCDDRDYVTCAQDLMAEHPVDFTEKTELFKRKATLVNLLNSHLDDLVSPQVKRYMTCRAVHAAKFDHELIYQGKGTRRGETRRRANQFFLIEASVGMQ